MNQLPLKPDSPPGAHRAQVGRGSTPSAFRASGRKFIKVRADFLLGFAAVLLPAASYALSTGYEPCGAAPSDSPSLERTILWQDDDRKEAIFIPEQCLKELDGLPMDELQQWVLESALAEFREGRVACFSPESSSGQGSSSDAASLHAMISGAPISLIGRHIRIVSGWSPWVGEVVQIHYLTAEEILASDPESRPPRIGSVVGILSGGGHARIEGVSVCQDKRDEFRDPLPGDQFLITGSTWEPDVRFFLAYGAFPVVNGQVHPQPYPSLLEGEIPRDLDQLRVQLRANKGKGE